jgi:C-terminal processing protease CtpA/Prc
MVEPLTSQMAEYLGVPSGLMVKQVAHKSEAAASGLKAFDVILKVGPDAVNTMSDWDRALRANQGKPVQVTILRDRKQQTLTLQVDSKHKSGELQMEELFPAGDCSMLAELGAEPVQLFSQDSQAAAKTLRDQAQTLKNEMLQGQMKEFQVTPEQAEKFSKDAEKLHEQFNMKSFKIDPKRMDDLKQQMEQFQQNFKLQDPENAPM